MGLDQLKSLCIDHDELRFASQTYNDCIRENNGNKFTISVMGYNGKCYVQTFNSYGIAISKIRESTVYTPLEMMFDDIFDFY